ncbi:hypothetical protein HanIR_Chr07g0302281 [Helianthus annuus]|nr:hypothetical protein HanIR_Chr07g0302281 [Helianthus annuus]
MVILIEEKMLQGGRASSSLIYHKHIERINGKKTMYLVCVYLYFWNSLND